MEKTRKNLEIRTTGHPDDAKTNQLNKDKTKRVDIPTFQVGYKVKCEQYPINFVLSERHIHFTL